jgi:hypothetical protein
MSHSKRWPIPHIFNFKHEETIFPVDQTCVLDNLGLFQRQCGLLTFDPYEVQSRVSRAVFAAFAKMVEGGPIIISEENLASFRLLAEEFEFEDLSAECDLLTAAHEPLSPITELSVHKEVSVGPGHRVTITVNGCRKTYGAFRSLREVKRFSRGLADSKEMRIKIEGVVGNDRLVEKAVRAVYANTVASLGENDTKKPFLASILWELRGWLHGWNIDSAIYCLNELHRMAPTGFDKARLLLLSQCKDVSRDDFVPRPNADRDIIIDAIGLLTEDKNQEREDADRLLQKLKVIGEHEHVLGISPVFGSAKG